MHFERAMHTLFYYVAYEWLRERTMAIHKESKGRYYIRVRKEGYLD